MTQDSPLTTIHELIRFIDSDIDLQEVHLIVKNNAKFDPAHDVSHLYRVALWTIRLGEGRLNPRAAIAASLLHDIINLPKNHSDRHLASEKSAEAARSILNSLNFLHQDVDEIADSIRTHSWSRGQKPTSFLGECLQDADRLEALGALGIARTFSTGVILKAEYFNSVDPWAIERPLDDSKYSVDHFFKKLLKIPSQMNTILGREEATRRAAVLEDFLSQLAFEIGHPRPDAPGNNFTKNLSP